MEDTAWWENTLNERHVPTTRTPDVFDPYRPVVFDLTGRVPAIALGTRESHLMLLADYATFRFELEAKGIQDGQRMLDRGHRARTLYPTSTVRLTRFPHGTWCATLYTPTGDVRPLVRRDNLTLTLDAVETDERGSADRWHAYRALGADSVGAVLLGRV